jgi:pyruvate formate lyase activating enzyme
MTSYEVETEAARDTDVFASSAGGVTISGGEPFMQADFLHELLQRFKAKKIHTAVETSAAANIKDIERCLPLIDLVLCDLKHTDAALLAGWTGGVWDHIEKNISFIINSKTNFLLRIPVIHGFNTDKKAFAGFAAFLQSNAVHQVELLPYHFLGEGKYAMLGMQYNGTTINSKTSYNESLKLKKYFLDKVIEAEISG